MALLDRLSAEIKKCNAHYWLFADEKKMLEGKRFCSNEEVIAKNEPYFKSQDESFYKNEIENLKKRWNDCISLK